jgi:hypothetical protein
MTKEEALDLALEALEFIPESGSMLGAHAEGKRVKAITAIKQALALDKMADNARELGLDYEPVPENFMDALRFDVAMRDAAPVQEPDLIARLKHPEDHYEFTDPKKANAVLMSLCQEAADALAAPVQEPVAWIEHHKGGDNLEWDNPGGKCTPLYTTPPAQPAPVQERTDYAVHLNHCNLGECEGVCKYLDDDCPALEHADMKAKWDRPTPPAAQPAPVQEPVADAWMHKDGRLTDAKAKTARVENFHGWRPLAFIASAAQPAPEQYTALEQALTRLQKRYGELEAKVAAQPKEEDLYDLALKADNGGQP